jgi:hypothetical protein
MFNIYLYCVLIFIICVILYIANSEIIIANKLKKKKIENETLPVVKCNNDYYFSPSANQIN